MKIGIITLPLHINYGGILQAYALQTVLKRMGHDVCLIEERRDKLRLPLWKAPLLYGKRILQNISGKKVSVFYEQKINREKPIVQQYTEEFIERYINVRRVNSFFDINEDAYEAIIVGSDQIWRPKYFPKIEHAYLDFTRGWDIRRIAYAASFGTDDWEYTSEQTARCSALLKRFDAVSVRERSAVSLCESHLGVMAVNTVDPTMLLEIEDYVKLATMYKTHESPGDLLCYVLDETPEITKYIDETAKKNGLVPFRINAPIRNFNVPLYDRVQPPVEQWLRGFMDARFVITDSFHACVFSILFNKPFIALGNEGRGMSRFKSLLSIFGLQNCLNVSMNKHRFNDEIDWSQVNINLGAQREFANMFLKSL